MSIDILLLHFLNIASVRLVVGGWCACGVPLLLVHIFWSSFSTLLLCACGNDDHNDDYCVYGGDNDVMGSGDRFWCWVLVLGSGVGFWGSCVGFW